MQPGLVAYDLHPEYLSTKYARELEEAGLPAVGVQHHHAHIASCLADNERPSEERVIGVALDGTGYGTDGAVWGGEFFEGSIRDGFMRRAHLEYAPLPGGAAAIRQPWRGALARLIALYGEEDTLKLPLPLVREAGERDVRLIGRLVERGLNTPPTSSAGRLFDAVAAIVGVPGSRRTTYEGQAAVELELAASGPVSRGYPFGLRPEGEGWVVETSQIVGGVVEDLLAVKSAADIFQVPPDDGGSGRCRLRADPGGGRRERGRALRRDLPELATRGAGVRVTGRRKASWSTGTGGCRPTTAGSLWARRCWRIGFSKERGHRECVWEYRAR